MERGKVGIKILGEAGDVIFWFPFYYQSTVFIFILAEPRRNGFHGPDSSTACQQLPNQALELKNLGNTEYEAERYSNAIEIYNRALVLCYHPTLLGNRAAAFLKRNWNGDIYSALIDSYHVIEMDSMHVKAHLR